MTRAAHQTDIALIERRATVFPFLDVIAENADASTVEISALRILAPSVVSAAKPLDDQRIHEGAPFGG